MSERSKEPVLKTGDVRASVGSNPTLSSKNIMMRSIWHALQVHGEVLKLAEEAPLLRV